MRLLLCWAFPSFFSTRHYVSPISYFSVPFFVAALFFFTIAQVLPCGDHLKYRRFRRWKSIPYSNFRRCREDWIFGYLRTISYLPPWGRLYFTRRQVGFRWDSDAINTIQFKAKQDLNRLYSSHTGPESKIHASFHLELLADTKDSGAGDSIVLKGIECT